MVWSRPLITSGVSRATYAFFQTILDGVDGAHNGLGDKANAQAVADALAEKLSKEEAADNYAPIATVDLASFLTPGEAMPNDGTTDAQPLFQRALAAVSALALVVCLAHGRWGLAALPAVGLIALWITRARRE